MNLEKTVSNRNVSILNSLRFFMKNFFNFHGRSSRGSFWYIQIMSIIPWCIFFFYVMSPLMSNAEKFTTNNKVNYFELVESVNFPIPDFFITIIALVLIIFSIGNISLTIRRLHDIELSGFWILTYKLPIPLISTISFIVLHALMLKHGTIGSNKYGQDVEAGK